MVGNPLISRINNLEPRGLQDNKDTPELILTWNAMPAGNPIVRRTFWIYNSSPFNMVIDWKLMIEVEEKMEENIDVNIEEEQGENVEGEDNEKIEGEQEIEDEVIKEEEIQIIEEPKLPNLCRVIFNIEENRENTLHCMLIPERNGEEWCVRVCF